MSIVQQQILDRVRQILTLSPDMRFGQLVSNLSFMARPEDLEPTPNVEDEEFLVACDEHLGNLQRMTPSSESLHVESAISRTA
ncbi:MAG: hypothetical protein SFV23_06890 [Planctomycetaceae bacterium]|nr:hypothetical protein [Planctomycetaceae bacterium]